MLPKETMGCGLAALADVVSLTGAADRVIAYGTSTIVVLGAR